MIWNSLWGGSVFRRRHAPPQYLASARVFQTVLERERMRADRSGGTFCVLAFRVRAGDAEAIEHLANALERRLRATDQSGFLEDGRVATLLPDTSLDGAYVVLRDLQSGLSHGRPAPPAEVWVYPSDNELNHDGAAHDGDREELASPAESATPMRRGAESLFVQRLPLWKRALDICGAATALVLASPLLLAICVAIKATSRGPALFVQQRGGIGGQPFYMYKFRTMYHNAEELKASLLHLNERDGPAFKLRDDPRVTPLGRYLRLTCLDEFPQFWNVLRGEMTLVGPRPLPCAEASQCAGWHKRRQDVTPGLTCIWQVRSLQGVNFNDWMRMDLRYIRSRRLSQDVKLLARTALAVVLQRVSQ